MEGHFAAERKKWFRNIAVLRFSRKAAKKAA
jgi:hypothetical protein